MQAEPPIHLWGIEAALHPVAGGHRNRVLRTIGLAQDVVFKSTRRTVAAVDWLVAVQAAARQSGFRVPRLIPDASGRTVAHGWTCEAFVAGTPFAARDLPGIAPQVAAFHRATAGIGQRPGFRSARGLLTVVSGGDVDLASMPPGVVRKCRQAWQGVEDMPHAVVHGDLNPGNLIRCADGRPALVDWDECRRDATLFDLGQLGPVTAAATQAILAWEVACCWQVEPQRAARLAARL